MGTLGGYILGQMVGRAQAKADASRASLVEANQPPTRFSRTSEEMAEDHERHMEAKYGPGWREDQEVSDDPRAGEILDLKKRLTAARAVRDTLREALAQVAPDHPLVSPLMQNPLLQDVATAAADRITRWDEPI